MVARGRRWAYGVARAEKGRWPPPVRPVPFVCGLVHLSVRPLQPRPPPPPPSARPTPSPTHPSVEDGHRDESGGLWRGCRCPWGRGARGGAGCSGLRSPQGVWHRGLGVGSRAVRAVGVTAAEGVDGCRGPCGDMAHAGLPHAGGNLRNPSQPQPSPPPMEAAQWGTGGALGGKRKSWKGGGARSTCGAGPLR